MNPFIMYVFFFLHTMFSRRFMHPNTPVHKIPHMIRSWNARPMSISSYLITFFFGYGIRKNTNKIHIVERKTKNVSMVFTSTDETQIGLMGDSLCERMHIADDGDRQVLYNTIILFIHYGNNIQTYIPIYSYIGKLDGPPTSVQESFAIKISTVAVV